MRTLWLVILALVACESDDAPPRTCDAPDDPPACLCPADTPTAEPFMPVDTCSQESVGEGGLCCESGDRRTCGCAAMGCFQTDVGVCTCGTTVEFGGQGTTATASCSPEGTGRCCLSRVDGY